MPYRRTYRSAPRRSYRSKGKAPIKKGQSTYQLAKQAYKWGKIAYSVLNAEKKLFDTAHSTAASSTGTFTCLNQIAQGDDANARSGRSILMKSLQLKGLLTLNGSATSDKIRYIVFIDNDAGGETPVATDLLVSDSVVALRQGLTNHNRFTVLMDKVINLSSSGNSATTINKFWPLSHHIKFDGTAVSDFDQGSIWLYCVATQPTNTTSQTLNFRLRYYDN